VPCELIAASQLEAGKSDKPQSVNIGVNHDVLVKNQRGVHFLGRTPSDGASRRVLRQAFQAEERSIGQVIRGKNPGMIADEDHGTRLSGDVRPKRNGSPAQACRHLRLSQRPGLRSAVHVCSAQLWRAAGLHARTVRLLREEADPAVRAVLGHLIFVYIHPYMEESSSLADYFCHNYSSLCAFP
jgi:hypothetical protein